MRSMRMSVLTIMATALIGVSAPALAGGYTPPPPPHMPPPPMHMPPPPHMPPPQVNINHPVNVFKPTNIQQQQQQQSINFSPVIQMSQIASAGAMFGCGWCALIPVGVQLLGMLQNSGSQDCGTCRQPEYRVVYRTRYMKCDSGDNCISVRGDLFRSMLAATEARQKLAKAQPKSDPFATARFAEMPNLAMFALPPPPVSTVSARASEAPPVQAVPVKYDPNLDCGLNRNRTASKCDL